MAIRYQALGPLLAGEGSRAFLGLAISEENKARPVVIIWVPEHAEKDPELLEKIRRETEHAAKHDHPNIVTVIGFATLDEGHARVVEFADGESLRKIVDVAKKLPPRFAARIICDACTGVHYAHIAGNDDGTPLVHGDVRPETLLVSFNGVTKVTGYGALAFAPRELGGQRVKGRRVHSAPEQIIGGRAAITIPTDVYLLGLALYECLTGQVPWADQGEFFDHAVLTLPLPPPPPGDVPEKLEPVIMKACAKKALDRYQTPLALREAIEEAMGSEIASAEELVKYLDSLFPQSHQLRADRRHTIDAGIADFVRRQWADMERKETVPMMRAVQVPPAAQPPPATPTPIATPAAKPPAPAAAPPPAHHAPVPKPPVVSEEEEDEEDEGSSTPWLIFLAVFIAIIAGWWGWKKANEPIPGVDKIEHPRPPPPVAKIDAGAPAIAAPTVEDAGAADAGEALAAEPADAGAAIAAAVDAGPAVTASGDVLVTIESSPRAELLLEGKSLGNTPWTGHLPPGRKVFTLQNKDLLLNSVRVINVKNEPVSEKFTFDKGFVTVTAPEGAVVSIDGVRVGIAPIRGEIPVFEGSHRINVAVGKANWKENFSLYAGQRVNFNVEMQ